MTADRQKLRFGNGNTVFGESHSVLTSCSLLKPLFKTFNADCGNRLVFSFVSVRLLISLKIEIFMIDDFFFCVKWEPHPTPDETSFNSRKSLLCLSICYLLKADPVYLHCS